MKARRPARSPSRSARHWSTCSTAAPRTPSAGCTASSDRVALIGPPARIPLAGWPTVMRVPLRRPVARTRFRRWGSTACSPGSVRVAWAWSTSPRAPTARGSRSRCCAPTWSATTRRAPGWPARSPRSAWSGAPASPRSSTRTRGDRRRSWRRATSRGCRCTSTSGRADRSPAQTSPTSPPVSRRLSTPCTGSACCTATSSRPTCCSRAVPRCSSTSVWPGWPRTRA